MQVRIGVSEIRTAVSRCCRITRHSENGLVLDAAKDRSRETPFRESYVGCGPRLRFLRARD